MKRDYLVGDHRYANSVITSGSARTPDALLSSDFIGVSITAVHAQQPGWATPSTFFFKRRGLGGTAYGWSLVGVERDW